MNTVTIKINGIEYNLKGRENEKYLLQIAEYVDGKVKDIMGNNKKLSSTAAATLVSLNIADELFKADMEIENLIKDRNTLEEKKIIFSERIKEIKSEYDKIINEKDDEIKKLQAIISSMEERLENAEKLVEVLEDKKSDDEYKEKFEKLGQEVVIMEEELKKNIKQKRLLEERNKDIKFQLQNSKYKVLDLENKLVDLQIELAKERKNKNVLLRK
ncbi:cell division protein ZapA [Clostridium septicum]|uniref:Cell division protein ZapA n=1 Tax=Clostridium septicum TaxID=1504 RepID=A0A9N7JML5_CLOSE|nr:cell division protein ZapA [Clostridium septicum]AYE35563.1 cell division protein ZapA [Clostridium septicum]MDU1314944.1 cell division protein ZapA [Clostridium septicum]QAS60950.1 cell division protein ZapA [Clostridium septicum]UEC19774.1 cell division protein ZapA [Clostridium septicum]USS02167.1 cell division protein ZapA [Clostridium septicum]